jgi:hypothetical protein
MTRSDPCRCPACVLFATALAARVNAYPGRIPPNATRHAIRLAASAVGLAHFTSTHSTPKTAPQPPRWTLPGVLSRPSRLLTAPSEPRRAAIPPIDDGQSPVLHSGSVTLGPLQ